MYQSSFIKKIRLILNFYDATARLANYFNTYIAQYLKK